MIQPFLKEMFDLSGKNAVVTGATGITGKWYAAGLAEAGANVVLVDINEEDLGPLAEEIRAKFGVKAISITCDVSDQSQVKAMAEKSIKEFGRIHILHNNAAGKCKNLDDYFAPFEDYSMEAWREMMDVNIDGMFLVAKSIGGHMAEAGGGSVIQTASIYGIMAPDHRIYKGSFYLGREINSPAVYSASKGAVVMLTKYLACYWREKNIRVNTLTPGGIQSGQNDEFISKYSARIPLGRMARPQEMVGALVYLASDASSYMTGHNMIVDGGLNAW